MDKPSIPSVNKSSLSFLDNDTFILSKESSYFSKSLFFTLVSEVTILLINYHQRRQKKYQTILESLNKKTGNNSISIANSQPRIIPVSKEILEVVLLKLNAFEQQKGYLSTSINLNSLSKILDTNSSYLSKIINHTKGKTFKNYLNDLRIENALEELKNNPQNKKFTIEAIAFDLGFKSAESFSKKFKSAYGMYPSKFMKNLAA
ncbi:MAG: AraC family transcriptional regulator [Bacteroidetes bacterium]|nr:MAG: AraC family transcriptional regulator [Bacteroidota bacterium]